MKILWLTTLTTLEHSRLLGLPGSVLFGWIEGLAAVLRTRKDISLAIASPAPVTALDVTAHDNIRFFAVPEKSAADDLRKVVEIFKPDAIHLHGTTSIFTGECGKTGDVPWIISIEGILEAWADWLNGNLRESDMPFSPKNFLLRRTFARQRRSWLRRAQFERAAIAAAGDLIGRTPLDRAYCKIYNPHAAYHCVNEVLRAEFYRHVAAWRYNDCTKFKIFIPSMAYPLKGAHVMLKALAMLKQAYPGVSLTIPGAPPHRRWPLNNPYHDYLLKLVRTLGLSDNVDFVPRLDAEGMAATLLSSHVFAMPSFMENSPNSLAEAQVLGVPQVASSAGGTPEFIDRKFLVQAGDPVSLAAGIADVFAAGAAIEDECRKVATAEAMRHDPQINAALMLNIYQQVSQHGKFH